MDEKDQTTGTIPPAEKPADTPAPPPMEVPKPPALPPAEPPAPDPAAAEKPGDELAELQQQLAQMKADNAEFKFSLALERAFSGVNFASERLRRSVEAELRAESGGDAEKIPGILAKLREKEPEIFRQEEKKPGLVTGATHGGSKPGLEEDVRKAFGLK